jgi:hypothetical protein
VHPIKVTTVETTMMLCSLIGKLASLDASRRVSQGLYSARATGREGAIFALQKTQSRIPQHASRAGACPLRRGTRTVVELANDYALTYAPFIQAAVREVGHNYRQVANWLTRERIPAQRNGQWKA